MAITALAACASTHADSDAGGKPEAGADADMICSDLEASPVTVHVQETGGYDVCNATVSMRADAGAFPFDCSGCPDAGTAPDATSDGGDAGRMIFTAGTCNYSVHDFRPPTGLYTISVVAPGYQPTSITTQVTQMTSGPCTVDFGEGPLIVVLSAN
jgi:hypothetical protein